MVESGYRFEDEVRLQAKYSCSCETRNNYRFYLPRINRGTECDVIIITQSKIYCVECKNFNGYISGYELDLEWRFASSGNKGKVSNPVLANNKHIRAIKGLFRKCGLTPPEIVSVVCVPNECVIHTDCEEVINLNQLVYKLKNDDGGSLNMTYYIELFDKFRYKEV